MMSPYAGVNLLERLKITIIKKLEKALLIFKCLNFDIPIYFYLEID